MLLYFSVLQKCVNNGAKLKVSSTDGMTSEPWLLAEVGCVLSNSGVSCAVILVLQEDIDVHIKLLNKLRSAIHGRQ